MQANNSDIISARLWNVPYGFWWGRQQTSSPSQCLHAAPFKRAPRCDGERWCTGHSPSAATVANWQCWNRGREAPSPSTCPSTVVSGTLPRLLDL